MANELPARIDVACPLCGERVDLPVHVKALLTHSTGNGSKGFLTAEVGIGGVEHTCEKE